MEGIKRVVLTLLMGYIICGFSLAYNSSLTNSSESFVWEEIPDRLNDNVIKTNNEVKNGFGGVISKYFILILLAVSVAIIIKVFKGWLI